jgi:hypothetical protein
MGFRITIKLRGGAAMADEKQSKGRQGFLTGPYIEDHMALVHTAESFGRALVEQILKAARRRLDKTEAESVELDAKITLTPVIARGCLQVCVGLPPVSVCYHTNVNL